MRQMLWRLATTLLQHRVHRAQEQHLHAGDGRLGEGVHSKAQRDDAGDPWQRQSGLASIYTEQKYDIIFLQEIVMNEDNAVAFIGQAHNWGYRAFLSSCTELGKRGGQESLQGGVAALVHRRWKARRSSSFVCVDGEFALVDLGCILVGPVYTRLRRLEGDLEENLRRRLLSEDRRVAWMLVGDWNLKRRRTSTTRLWGTAMQQPVEPQTRSAHRSPQDGEDTERWTTPSRAGHTTNSCSAPCDSSAAGRTTALRGMCTSRR